MINKSKQFLLIFGGFLAIELASFSTIDIPLASSIMAIVLALFVAIFTWRNPAYGVYALMAELILGGKGYLFSLSLGTTAVSFRMLIFIMVLSIWLAKWLLKEQKIKYLRQLFGPLWWPYLALLAMILLGITTGLLRQNGFDAVSFDVNGFGYLLLAPIFLEILKKEENQKQTIQIWLIAAFWLAIKTIILFIIFSYFERESADYLYRWVRNSGVGEITWLSTTRVFLYSQIFIVAAWLYILFNNFNDKLKKTLPILILFVSAILISLSRSFFVGIAISIILIGVYWLWQKKFSDFPPVVRDPEREADQPSAGKILSRILISAFGAYLLVLLLSGSLFSPQSRLINDAGQSSRRNQWPVLVKAIVSNPFGYGFGKTLTYQTTDPRALFVNPSGQYTTYSFELGWLDFFLKTGLFGVMAYLWFLGAILRQIWPDLSLVTPLVALFIIHSFTPYLNHPLGIGLLLFFSALILTKQKKNAYNEIIP